MLLKGVIFEDFVNYKKTSMVLEFPYCSFKCDKECGEPVCQNGALAQEPNISVSVTDILMKYKSNPITEAIVFQGLEPFESFTYMCMIIDMLRNYLSCNDDVVIYTGYDYYEIADKVDTLSRIPNIIIKFGRYIKDQQPHFDEVLGVNLASDNQYAKKVN